MAVRSSGQLVLFQFPQTDLALGKLRPALLLAPMPSGHNDWLVCLISSQINQAVAGVDEVLTTTDADFAPSGLKIASVIRLTRVAVVSESIFVGIIAEISAEAIERAEEKAGKLD